MTSTPSPQGRRIIIAVVTGEAGERIQAWRLQHDAKEAVRLPPHATLCYWAPDEPVDALEKQVRHAFPRPVEVELGGVKQGNNDQGTLYVEVVDPAPLQQGLERLYDGTYAAFPAMDHWRWHVTCVRDTRGKDVDALKAAATSLQIDGAWCVDTVALMELRGDRYEDVARWTL